MYDQFSQDYDRFVNWRNRLGFELPFLESTLAGANRVLDAACGTGMHAIALAQRGFQTSGADLSPAMIERARANARAAGVEARFEAAGFGALAKTFSADEKPFDALLCLGNSLPHLLSRTELERGLADFAACLRPGGMLVLQNRNFDLVMRTQQRWMGPEAQREGEADWLFVRFYDFRPDGLLDFHILTLRRPEPAAAWQQSLTTIQLRPLLQAELLEMLSAAGFTEIVCYGSLGCELFDLTASGNLVVVARSS